MRKQIAAANWKMNLTLQQAQELLSAILSSSKKPGANHQVIFGIPFPFLAMGLDAVNGKDGYEVAAQNCHDKKAGAYTGETAAAMLQSIGVKYCIVGHSERREYFGETNQIIAAKIDRCLESSLIPVFCCGEPLAIREAGTQNEYVATQLKESLFHLSPAQLKTLIIAYEPIWAIGTGKTASTEQAQEIHAYIRSVLAGQYLAETAAEIPILYGGSVKANNAKELFSCPDVDGGLVGGASIVAADFLTIIESLK